MSRTFQTTIEANQSKVLIISGKGVLLTQLVAAVRALHLDPVPIDPARFVRHSFDQELRSLCTQAYMVIWMDFPVFCDQEIKRREYVSVIQALRSLLQIPLILVTFDAFKVRENGSEDRNPTFTTQWLIQAVKGSLTGVRHVDYQHVIYPYEAGVSVVQRFLLEKISLANEVSLEGKCYPLWFTDAIEHLVSLLYDVTIPGGIFEGRIPISFQEMERVLRKTPTHLAFRKSHGRFPYTFATQAQQIGQIPPQKSLEELATIAPHPTQKNFADVQIVKPFIAKSEVVRRRAQSSGYGKYIGVGLGIILILYLLISAFFLYSFFQVRQDLTAFVLSPTAQLEQNARLQSRLRFIHSYVSSLPFPYAVVGIHLDTSRILEGTASISNLVEAQDTFEKEKNLTYFGNKKTVSGNFESIYQDLSTMQAKLSQGDLTLDLVFGIDGFSEKLRLKLAEIRQRVSQEKAIASFLPELLGQTKRRTLAIVSFSTDTTRPFFGLPTQVGIVTFEEGKVLSSQVYDPATLDTFLKGTTQPPQEMGEMTELTNWKLSSGTWSVDGPTSARQVSWFLTKELHQDIDALVFVDTKMQSTLLAILSQSKIAAGVTVLGANTDVDLQTVFDTIQNTNQDQKEQFVENLKQSFERGEATVFAKDPEIQKTLQALSWDGSISTPGCPPQFAVERDCIVSTRYLGEYDVKKSEESDGYVQKTGTSHEITLTPEHTLHTDTTTYPKLTAGSQEKLLKYVVDQEASEGELEVNGIPLLATEYSISQEFSKTVFSVKVKLESTHETQVVLHYETKPIAPTKSALVFFFQKQLGKKVDDIQLAIHYPRSYTAKVIAPAAVIEPQSLTFSDSLRTNTLFAVGF